MLIDAVADAGRRFAPPLSSRSFSSSLPIRASPAEGVAEERRTLLVRASDEEKEEGMGRSEGGTDVPAMSMEVRAEGGASLAAERGVREGREAGCEGGREEGRAGERDRGREGERERSCGSGEVRRRGERE